MSSDFERQLKAALTLPQETNGPWGACPLEQIEPAAVLCLFGWMKNGSGPLVLFLKRAETVEKHKGQIAFPGGRSEPGEDALSTALRETHEEVGISSDFVRVLGALPRMWTMTGYSLTPVIGLLNAPIDEVVLSLQESEVAETFWAPLSILNRPESYRREYFLIGEKRFETDVYRFEEHRIWGITGSILKNIVDRLHLAQQLSGSTSEVVETTSSLR